MSQLSRAARTRHTDEGSFKNVRLLNHLQKRLSFPLIYFTRLIVNLAEQASVLRLSLYCMRYVQYLMRLDVYVSHVRRLSSSFLYIVKVQMGMEFLKMCEKNFVHNFCLAVGERLRLRELIH